MACHNSVPVKLMRRRARLGLALLAIAAGAGLSAVSIAQQMEDSPVSYLMLGRKTPIDEVKWQPLRSWTFDDPDVMSAFEVIEGAWEVRDGALWATEGDGNRSILLTSLSGTSLRIEFDATSYAAADGAIGDITLMLNARAGRGATDNGYALTTGSYFNTCTTFYREGRKLARTEHATIVLGKTNHVVIEMHAGHIRYMMNDHVLLEAWEDKPLEFDPGLGVGLRTWATRMRVDNLRLFVPAT